MDREKILNFYNMYYRYVIQTEEYKELLYNYCIDNGKDKEESLKFIDLAYNFPPIWHDCIFTALNYYGSIYNICIIKDFKDKILLIF